MTSNTLLDIYKKQKIKMVFAAKFRLQVLFVIFKWLSILKECSLNMNVLRADTKKLRSVNLEMSQYPAKGAYKLACVPIKDSDQSDQYLMGAQRVAKKLRL